MSEEGKDYQDSDTEFERPKDEYLFFYKAFKLEEKKMLVSTKLDEIATKYWQLIRSHADCDIRNPTINQELYTHLMKRIYKVLLPLYKEDEMKSEISQEWLMDSRGQPEMNYSLFTKLLFRVAHQWATNIDIEEYVNLLNRIYDRIILKQITTQVGGFFSCNPHIQVDFPLEEKKIIESGGKFEKQAKLDDWLECRSNESEKSDNQYEYKEDTENMMTKKYKKPKNNFGTLTGEALSGVPMTIKEPFVYNEQVDFFQVCNNIDFQTSIVEDKLLDMQDILPFGYIAEQFISYLKNDINTYIEDWKLTNKKENSTRQLNFANFNTGEQQAPEDADKGLVDCSGQNITLSFNIERENYCIPNTYFQASLSDYLYNQLRRIVRDGAIMSLRMFSPYPKPGAKSRTRSIVSNDPITEINRFGFNPALERRLKFKLYNNHYYNIHYMLNLEQYAMVYRMDVARVETKGKLAIKEQDDMKKDEEFVNVETSYKRLRQIMLTKKFGNIYLDRQSSDIKEHKRLKKLVDREEKRKEHVLSSQNIASKGLQETFEENTFIKMMKGPFYNLESKEGLKEDNFVNTAEWDLIEAARTQALKILVIGKPRSGKSTLAKNLALKLDLVHINLENWIIALLEKIKNYEPPELAEDEEAPQFLSDLEQNIHNALKAGYGPSDADIVQILKDQINSPSARLKGFILDLHFYKREKSWANTIKQEALLGKMYEGSAEQFSHVIELAYDDEEIMLRAQNMKSNPEDGNVYSRWEREERKRLNAKKGEEEDAMSVDADEEKVVPPVLDESSLVQRSNDTAQALSEELQYYNTVERSGLEELLISLYDNQYIKIDAASLTPEEVTECVACKIKFDEALPLRPVATVIEGGNDFKSLLTEGVEENQIPRKWSLFKQIDPVELQQGKVIQGLPEFAVSYHNNVFVFSSEETMKKFVEDPKSYIENGPPQMPGIYRVLMLGPKGIGKHTQAKLLQETYGWRIVDFPELVRTRLEELAKTEVHIPNNPVGGRIGLSEQELADVIEGKPFPAWKYVPWILDYLGYELEKKRPPPVDPNVEENKDEEEEDEDVKKKKDQDSKKKRDEEERKRKEEEENQRQKEERRRQRQEAKEQGKDLAELGLEESEEEPIIIDDLSIDQLVLKQDEATGRTAYVGGFILIGYPETEEHINKLKEHTIEFDKIIYLTDTSEEEPGQEIKNRMKDDEMYDWDWENENAQRILALAKEHLGGSDDLVVKEISANGKQEDVLIRIRSEIDPFYLKIDNPDDYRMSADLGEEDRKLPKGDFGDYCPVTYVKDNWIVRGNPEQEVTIYGKTYWLSGEKEAEEFKFNPAKFLVTQNGQRDLPLTPPPPKIMIVGMKGSGVTTQIHKLCEKYKFEPFLLQKEFLAKLKEEKEKRKRRRLLDRGFKPPLPPEEEDGESPPDPEIEDDPEDFDKEGHEREVMKMILDSNKALVIDGTWTDLPEDSGVTQTLQDLLFESRRVPEIVILLKCKEPSTFNRIIDVDAIRTEYDRLMKERTEAKQKLREEDRAAKLKELQDQAAEQENEDKTPEEVQEGIREEMEKWEQERDEQEEADDENDAEKPNFEEMLEKQKEALRERREKDEAFLEEFGTALKEKEVFVIDDIKTDISADYVFVKLLDRIQDNLHKRGDLIEKQQAQSLKPEEVPFYEKSYVYKHSKFGVNSPLSLSNPCKNKQNVVLYRERLYFLSSPDEQQEFLKQPSKYTEGTETIPLDILIKPKIFVLGMPKSGKSTLAKIIAQKTGVVYLKMSKIVELFAIKDRDSVQCDTLRRITKIEGRHLEDDLLINLLQKRLQFQDCQLRGWILEDFPKTRNQAILMAKKGLVPTNVFSMSCELPLAFERTQDKQQSRFGANRIILSQRIKFFQNNLPFVLSFYQRHYSNVCEIDTSKSKWQMEDRAMRELTQNLEARQSFARDYYLRDSQPRGCKLRNMHIDNCLCKQSLSEFKYYCPVTWKNEKTLVKCNENTEDAVLYKNYFYFFKSTKERDMFLSNPTRFLTSTSFPTSHELPLRLQPHKAAEIIVTEKSLGGHCSVTLMDEERVVKGDQILLIHYKETKFAFETEFKLQRFYRNPFKYSRASLPVKMPAVADKVSLYNLQKMEDSISFMEQALGSIVTKGLREVSENRLKYPTISVKETMLKLFSLYLKTENPANTGYMKQKYQEKMKKFIQRCELPEEIFDLAQEKTKNKDKWPAFKENYYNELGATYDKVIMEINQEKVEGFSNYIR